jgi:tetratricopeptide (TPR) repeat protein
MAYLKKIPLVVIILLSFFKGKTQEAAAIDSIKMALAEAKTPEEKVYLIDNLSRALMNVNPAEAEEYGKQLITFAEESRDRKLMVKAYVSNGIRCGYRATHKEFSKRSAEYYTKALEIARINKMEDELGAVLLHLSLLHLTMLDNDKALSYINQAFSLISTLKNDSLKAESHNVYGRVYLARNDKILALRHYLNALRLAEDTKNASLLRNCYSYLSDFYRRIDDHDKAIDYFMLAYKKLDDMKERNVPYQRVIDLNSIGSLFSLKKNYDLAIYYYERSIAAADSLKFSTLKLPGYISLLNQYLRIDQPQQALEYMSTQQGLDLKKYLGNFGYSYAIDQTYAVIYTELSRFYYARYYFSKSHPYFETNLADNLKINF